MSLDYANKVKLTTVNNNKTPMRRIRGIHKQLAQTVEVLLSTTTDKNRKMTRVYQKDECVI